LTVVVPGASVQKPISEVLVVELGRRRTRHQWCARPPTRIRDHDDRLFVHTSSRDAMTAMLGSSVVTGTSGVRL